MSSLMLADGTRNQQPSPMKTRGLALNGRDARVNGNACRLRGIHGFLLRLNLPQEVGVADRPGFHEVNVPLEQALQRRDHTQVSVGVRSFGQGLELNHEVQVAAGGIEVGAQHRAEQRQPAHSVSSSVVKIRYPLPRLTENKG